MGFEKGASGNPAGRPRLRDLSLSDTLKRKAGTVRTKAKIADRLIKLATDGESETTQLAALKLLFEQIDGRPAQKPPEKRDSKLTVAYEEKEPNAEDNASEAA